jgi:hypothetical protein
LSTPKEPSFSLLTSFLPAPPTCFLASLRPDSSSYLSRGCRSKLLR